MIKKQTVKIWNKIFDEEGKTITCQYKEGNMQKYATTIQLRGFNNENGVSFLVYSDVMPTRDFVKQDDGYPPWLELKAGEDFYFFSPLSRVEYIVTESNE